MLFGGKKISSKVCSVILYSSKALKKVFQSELQLTIIWLKLSPAPPVIINMQEKEDYLQPSYSGGNVAHQRIGTLIIMAVAFAIPLQPS